MKLLSFSVVSYYYTCRYRAYPRVRQDLWHDLATSQISSETDMFCDWIMQSCQNA